MAIDPNTNPYARGLLVKLEGAELQNPQPHQARVTLGNTVYDVSPYLGAYEQIGNVLQQFSQNPYDPRPLIAMHQMAAHLRPHIMRAAQGPMAIRQAIHPMLHGLASYVKHSQQLIKMRLKTAHHLARAPKIMMPWNLVIAPGATFSNTQFRNPYLGASGGNQGPYLYPWAITAFRTSNNESFALSPVRITQFLLGGHDFVSAALSGVTYAGTVLTGAGGWGAAAFAETARKHWSSVIQPWNVVAVSGAGVGFGSIMTETGFLQMSAFNGGAGTFTDQWSVYCNATLCGSPFNAEAHTQLDVFKRAFAPLALQGPLAMKLAMEAGAHIAGALSEADQRGMQQLGTYNWVNGVGDAWNTLRGFVDNPPNGVAMSEDFIDPQSMGMSLQGDASYV